jgi:hypothetical protein
VNEPRAQRQTRLLVAQGVRITLPAHRAAWILVACSLLLATLWQGPAALLGSPAGMQVVQPVSGAGGMVEVSAQGLHATFDRQTGRLTLHWHAHGRPAATLSGVAGVRLRGSAGSGPGGELLASDYARHMVTLTTVNGPFGQGTQVTFSHQDRRYPPLQQRLILTATGDAVLQTALGSAHGPLLEADRIDPLIATAPGAAILSARAGSIVFTTNGVTADHMPRLFAPLAALPLLTSAPYVTTISTPGGALLAGALSATNWVPSVQLQRRARGLEGLSLSETGPVSGPLLTAEPFLLGYYASGQRALRAYAAAVAKTQTPLPAAGVVQLGWSSWGAYELRVTGARVRRNVDFVATHLRALGYTTIHIDDGWEQRYGDWQSGPGFPGGMAALAAYIHAHGLKASLWFAPFLVAPNSWPARQHPEWLLRGSDGAPVNITISSLTYVLDATNPGALDYILSVCARIRNWGFDAVKLDFLYTGAMDGQRYRFDRNGAQAYAGAMAAIRAVLEANPHHPLYLIGVQQGFLPAGFFQAWRVGRDIESKTNADHLPTWDLVRREALAISAYAFADGTVYGTDPDDLLLRSLPGARNLDRDELRTYATIDALGGAVWLSGDDLPLLARQGRLGYLTNPEVLSVVRAGRAGMPLSLNDQLAGPAPLWEASQPDGSTVMGLFNWTDHAQRLTVSFAALGLAANEPFTVRDLWARAMLLHAARAFSLALRPHQSYLLRLSTAL